MPMPTTRLAALCLLSLTACDTDRGVEADGTFAIRGAALNLPGVTDAVYKLSVRNEAGDTVWSKVVSSSAYGDGAGSVTYVGPCDASDVDGDGVATNEVLVSIVDLVGPPPGSWFNPTAAGPAVLNATCSPNADTAVNFSFTILRVGDDGFFDIGVDFADIFCSAKYDGVDAEGRPLDLLTDDAGNPLHSQVLAVACTAGPDSDLRMYADDVTVTCASGETYTLGMSPDASGQRLSAPPFFPRYQVGAGAGALADVDQLYWTMVSGIDPRSLPSPDGSHLDCVVQTRLTASEGPMPAEGTVYPYIEVKVPLTDAKGSLACTTHPLGGGNGVSVSYGEPKLLAHELTHTVQQGGG